MSVTTKNLIFCGLFFLTKLYAEVLFIHDGIKVDKSHIPGAGQGIIVKYPIKAGEIILLERAIFTVSFDDDATQSMDIKTKKESDFIVTAYDKLSANIKQEFDDTLFINEFELFGLKEKLKAAGISKNDKLFTKYMHVIGRYIKYNYNGKIFPKIGKINHHYPTNVICVEENDLMMVIATVDLNTDDELYTDYYNLMYWAHHSKNNPQKN